MINSGIVDLRFEIFQVKARIAAHSGTICQISNADLDDFGRQAACHELIISSLMAMRRTDDERALFRVNRRVRRTEPPPNRLQEARPTRSMGYDLSATIIQPTTTPAVNAYVGSGVRSCRAASSREHRRSSGSRIPVGAPGGRRKAGRVPAYTLRRNSAFDLPFPRR